MYARIHPQRQSFLCLIRHSLIVPIGMLLDKIYHNFDGIIAKQNLIVLVATILERVDISLLAVWVEITYENHIRLTHLL